MTKLDELKALMAKATPGPWAVDPDDRPGMEWNNHIVGADANMAVCFMAHDNTPGNVEGFANADLITSSINALPALIAAVEALKEARPYVMAYSPSGKPFDWPKDLIGRIDLALAPFGE